MKYINNKNINTRYLLTIGILIIKMHFGYTQEIGFKTDVDFYFDNREYFTSYAPHYTIFGIRTTPQITLSQTENHQVNLGINLIQNFGESTFSEKIAFVGNYDYTTNNFQLSLGFVPRNKIPMHRFLLNDTLTYFRPFIEGMVLSGKFGHSRQQLWIDWLSMQTETIRESFMIGHSGAWELESIFIQHDLLMIHHALPGNPKPEDHIRDNLGGVIMGGYRFDENMLWDSLSLGLGTMFSLDRLRSVYEWKKPIGVYLQANYIKGPVGVNLSFYKGDKHDLLYGDKFYSARRYLRGELAYAVFNLEFVQADILFAIHLLPGGVDHSQSFRLSYTFDK